MNYWKPSTLRVFTQLKKVPHTFCDADSTAYHQGVTDTIFNSSLKSWLSSFVSMRLSLELNLATDGGAKPKNNFQQSLFDEQPARQIDNPGVVNKNGRQFKGAMLLPLAERQALLGEIYEKIKRLTAGDEEKFQELKTIV